MQCMARAERPRRPRDREAPGPGRRDGGHRVGRMEAPEPEPAEPEPAAAPEPLNLPPALGGTMRRRTPTNPVVFSARMRRMAKINRAKANDTIARRRRAEEEEGGAAAGSSAGETESLVGAADPAAAAVGSAHGSAASSASAAAAGDGDLDEDPYLDAAANQSVSSLLLKAVPEVQKAFHDACREAFLVFDINDSGYLSSDQLHSLMVALNFPDAATPAGETHSFDEFMLLLLRSMRVRGWHDCVADAFAVLDQRQVSGITAHDLCVVIPRIFGKTISLQHAVSMVTLADFDADGVSTMSFCPPRTAPCTLLLLHPARSLARSQHAYMHVVAAACVRACRRMHRRRSGGTTSRR
eukprot:SAG22_NODE_243_length_14055_cov_3.073015_5_plen_354_part_00